MVRESGREDLRLVFQTTESSRVDYPVPIPPEFVAIGMGLFRITPSQGTFNGKPEPRQHTFRKHFSACPAAGLVGLRRSRTGRDLTQYGNRGPAHRVARAGAERSNQFACLSGITLGQKLCELQGGLIF